MLYTEAYPGIYCVSVPLPGNPLKAVNSYFIPPKGGMRGLLVDTGFKAPESCEVLTAALNELDADMENTDIFLTHSHSDHAGLSVVVVGENSKIFVSEADHERLTYAGSDRIWESRFSYYLREGFPENVIASNIRNNPVRIYAPGDSPKYTSLNEGSFIRAGEFEFECILTPGHSPGHMCLYDRSRKLMLVGDHVLFDITPNITSWIGFENSLGQYINSLKKIDAYDVETALPGHRKSGDFHARIAEIIKHHEVRLAETLRLVGENPGLPAYELAGKMTWRMRYSTWEDFPPNQKWFAVGETIAHLEYLLAENRIFREVENGIHVYFKK